MHTSTIQIKGLSMALSSAIFWGISGTCAQFLFEQKNVDPAWLVSWRLLLAGFILVILSIFNPKLNTFEIWKNQKDAVQLLLFSLLGMVAVQFTYFYSIHLSNAATATVLQYIGPLFVVTFYAIRDRRWPKLIEYASLILALAGTFLLVTHGSFSQLVISDKALFWGILSAIALAFYTIQPGKLLRKYSPSVVTGWGMLIGGVIFSSFTTPFSVSGTWDIETWAAFGYIIIFGSLLAFYFFLTSVTIISPQTASLLCSVEPLSAALVAVIWLDVSFGKMDWIGTLFILITIALLTLATKPKKLLS
jgi:drug/metabolite transporter (DMT)-like permease